MLGLTSACMKTHTHTVTEALNLGLVGSFINELCCAGRAAVMTLQNEDAVAHTHTI